MKHLLILFRKSCIILIIILITGACKRSSVNLIVNPGFEEGSGDTPAGWLLKVSTDKKGFISGIDTSEYHSGRASYRISRIWSYGWQAGIKVADPVLPDPDKKYLMDFWYRTSGIEEYPFALVAQFKVSCDSTPVVTYRKNVGHSDEWMQYFILLDNIPPDAKNIEISFYSSIRTKGSIWIDDIRFFEAGKKDLEMFSEWRKQPVPRIPLAEMGKKFESTGYFRVQKDNSRWWLVDPEGNPFWAIATVGDGPVPDEKRPATQTDWFKKVYGTTSESATEKTYDILQNECGFNSFAGWTDRRYAVVTEKKYSAGQSYMPLTHVLNLSNAGDLNEAYARDRDGKMKNTSGHWVVDPYNPAWRKLAREKVEKVIPEYKGKPWFLGWYVDNEMDYDDLFRFIWAEYSSQEFIKSLKAKYRSVEIMNKSWTSSFGNYQYSSFNDLLEARPEPKDWDDPLWIDFVAFERQMTGEYINFTYNLIKEYDPEHLVISNRLHLGPMSHLYRTIDLWGKYDVVCMNIYPDNNKRGFNPGEIEIFRMLYKGTGRPIMLGEWSVPAIDSKLYEFGPDPFKRPLDWSFPQVLWTQKERGEVYEMCTKQLASIDFMIGSGWFKTTDVDSEVRRANRGLMNGRYELYTDLVKAMYNTNSEIKKQLGLK